MPYMPASDAGGKERRGSGSNAGAAGGPQKMELTAQNIKIHE